ncbi:hypothetical protein DFH07DRAFT_950173 [Mycena maculata]|uniref:Uncharacterized protein n=1 Tax=Mycena maculata TaxID=230809 RepID=A0AAD7K7V7_9AGAR|nr:hypothetical protein DFH07DRAFT_950173 [Mycena maculata]
MSQLRPIKQKLDQEELRAVFDRNHWYFLRENNTCQEINYRTAEQNAVGHTDASAVEDFIFQVGIIFRTLEQAFLGFSAGRFADLQKSFIERKPPEDWLKTTFRIPEVRTRVVNPFDLSPSAFKELGSQSSAAPPSKKSRSAPAAPSDSDDSTETLTA